ncbi:hypothetical protein EON65_18385, partial [archaeon]
MLSLWGKKTTEETAGTNKGFFYNFAGGQILSADGSGYILPDLGKIEAEKVEYIPKDFAEQKVKALTNNTNQLKETYHAHIGRLDSHYQTALKDCKDHYESIIKDLKKKAARHVEVNKQMRQQVEDRLNRELRQSEDALEELRDDMARLNRDYQDEMRKLKTKLHDAEDEISKQRVILQDHDSRSESKLLTTEIISAIEIRELEQQHQDTSDSLWRQIDELKQSYESQLQVQNDQHNIQLQTVYDNLQTTEQCRESLNDMLVTLEIQELKRNFQTMASLRSQMDELVLASQLSEQEVARQRLELQSALEAHSAMSEQSQQYVQEIDLVRNQYEADKALIVLQHEEALGELNCIHEEQLELLRKENASSEVKICLNEIVLAIMQNSLHVAEEGVRYHSRELTHSQSSLQVLQQVHNEKLSQSHGAYTEQLTSLQKKYDAEVHRLVDQNNRLEVALVLEDIVGRVVHNYSPLLGIVAASGGTAGSVSVPASVLEEIQHMKAELETARKIIAEKQKTVNQSGDLAAIIPPSGGDQAPASSDLSAEETELSALKLQLAELTPSLKDAEQRLRVMVEDRERVKVEIKDWTKKFQEEQGREPEVADKALIKDKYQKYKTVSSMSKEQEAKVEEVKGKKEAVEKEIRRLEGIVGRQKREAAGGVFREPVDMKDQEVQVVPHELRQGAHQQLSAIGGASVANLKKLMEGGAGEASKDGAAAASKQAELLEQIQRAHEEELEKLEDQLYDLRVQTESLTKEKAALESEKDFVAKQLESLIKEKRTDVIKRFEEDLERLTTSQKDLNEKVTSLNSEKVRLEVRVKELTSRAELAEQELKERDARELASANLTEEKNQLKVQINKQRDQIVLKSKAATAGWDAAAKADEKVDLEIQRAYAKGAKEEREQHKKDLDGINKSLEMKEVRITELLVQVGEMERKVRDSVTEKDAMKVQMEAMKLEVADAVAAIQAVGMAKGGGEGMVTDDNGEVSLPPSQAELDHSREQLDSAQEELVQYIERCEKLEHELEMARKKNVIYERLSAMTGLSKGKLTVKLE